MPKNTVPQPRRASAPKKPKTKPAAKAAEKPDVVHQEHVQPAAEPNRRSTALNVAELPDWVDFNPLADYRLVAWESDETTVEVLLTSEEYAILRDHLARIRGYVVGGSNAK